MPWIWVHPESRAENLHQIENYLVRNIESEEVAVIEVINGGDESRPNLELVLRNEDGALGIVVMTTHLLQLQHLHHLTEEYVEHLRQDRSKRKMDGWMDEGRWKRGGRK